MSLSWLGRRDDSNVRTCALFSVGLTTCVLTAISTPERVLRHQGRSASSQRQRKSSRWQQRAHVCDVLRRFDNTSLNGYQPLVDTHERCSTREDQAHRHNGNAQWQHRGCGRPGFEHSERFASSVPLSHQQVRRARARRRTICSPERCSARVGVGEGAGVRGN